MSDPKNIAETGPLDNGEDVGSGCIGGFKSPEQSWAEDRALLIKYKAEIERLRAECEDHKAAKLALERTNAPLLAAQAENEWLRAALRKIERETGETMRATNHGRRGDIAHEIACDALAS